MFDALSEGSVPVTTHFAGRPFVSHLSLRKIQIGFRLLFESKCVCIGVKCLREDHHQLSWPPTAEFALGISCTLP